MKKIVKFVHISAVILSLFCLFSCGNKNFMVKVKGGTFSEEQCRLIEGLKVKEPDILEQEKNPKKFELRVNDFYISKFEVTQQLYDSIMRGDEEVNSKPSLYQDNPAGKEKQELRPVEQVTWYDCLLFCNKLSIREGLEPVYTIDEILRYTKGKGIKKAVVTADFSKNGYRLPTRAEWMYAAFGGSKSKGKHIYSGSDRLDEVAWNEENSDEMTHQVGLKKPNELGLYDMTGNVAEWCWDYIWSEKLDYDVITGYKGPESGRYRYIVGGAHVKDFSGIEFYYENYKELGAVQGLRYHTTGFRIARNVK
ncbi:MAG: SUMF1/EgtB/PvdO family nonheme iron enzyme [Treponema sp.]|uniref:formylglycine-generating enzyme family protein n=1 Tax=Treponema sp. TaxID=166 RepID=UPI001B599CBA|nr:SUMF1/EgtB/PvdO family nonheme iron enzyme [Treponema sp.]MBP5402636.1 SUMF1/EgtB/PvdO family nonheme iron enzyme [Treponema sp.]MBR5933783.1 SUMF1/EgtB/PvdO family nonheme iron enzyme [Treponema sp.]